MSACICFVGVLQTRYPRLCDTVTELWAPVFTQCYEEAVSSDLCTKRTWQLSGTTHRQICWEVL